MLNSQLAGGSDLPEGARLLVEESFLVRGNILVLDTCKNANFVQGVFFFPVRQVLDLDLLECVDLAVVESFHLVDT